MKHHDQNQINEMVKRQMVALGIFFFVAVFGFMAMAVNIRMLMAAENPYLMVALFQIPMALAGVNLGMVLIQAGRKEKLVNEKDEM